MKRPWGMFAAAVLAGSLAYGFVIAPNTSPELIRASLVLRGILAGLVTGLALSETKRPGTSPEWPPLAGLSASAVGAVFLLLTTDAGDASLSLMLLSVLVATGVALAAAWLHSRWRIAAQIGAVAVVVLVGFWSLGFLPGPYRPMHQGQIAYLQKPLVAEQYNFDGQIFRRTVVLMKQGSPYYAAFAQANREDSRIGDEQLASPFNFREPLLFYFWALTPGSEGPGLLALYAIFAAGATVAGWFLSKRFVGPGVALLSAVALATYFAFFGLAGSWFAMVEVWAAFFVILALSMLVNRLYLPSAIIISVAVAIRELAFVFVPVWVIAWLFSKQRKRDLPGVLVAVFVPAAAILLHVIAAPASRVGGLGLSAWLNSTGFPRLIKAVAFAADGIPLASVLLPLGLLCGLIGSLFVRSARLRWTMLAALVVPSVFLLVASKSEWDYYWGAIFTPAVITLAPLILVPLLRPAESSVVVRAGRVAFVSDETEPGGEREATKSQRQKQVGTKSRPSRARHK